MITARTQQNTSEKSTGNNGRSSLFIAPTQLKKNNQNTPKQFMILKWNKKYFLNQKKSMAFLFIRVNNIDTSFHTSKFLLKTFVLHSREEENYSFNTSITVQCNSISYIHRRRYRKAIIQCKYTIVDIHRTHFDEYYKK
mgnify:CR=1 FL=1